MTPDLATELRDYDALARALQERTAQLEAVSREYDQFMHSVAHDLRAPLRSLEGLSEILTEESGSQLNDETKRCLEIIAASSRKASLLLEDLQMLWSLNRREMVCETIDMRALVQETAQILKPAWNRVELRLAELPEAWGDRDMLAVVWRKLMENALKFSRHSPQPVISIMGTRNAEKTAYFIRDNGVGFDMNCAGRLFGIFQRLHSEQEYEGRGAGLAIAQRIIRRHGGDISAEGVQKQGAMFRFSLPVHPVA
jgi:light-regulated signal transduction histidine kinase (bacteriophytochrome)